MNTANYTLVLYQHSTVPIYIGYKTLKEVEYRQFTDQMFRMIEIDGSPWSIHARRSFKVETSVYTTFFVIIDAIKSDGR